MNNSFLVWFVFGSTIPSDLKFCQGFVILVGDSSAVFIFLVGHQVKLDVKWLCDQWLHIIRMYSIKQNTYDDVNFIGILFLFLILFLWKDKNNKFLNFLYLFLSLILLRASLCNFSLKSVSSFSFSFLTLLLSFFLCQNSLNRFRFISIWRSLSHLLDIFSGLHSLLTWPHSS